MTNAKLPRSPGRFFVAYEIKMIVVYLLMNYDIKRIPERPKTRWFGATLIPALGAQISLRKRRVPVEGWLQ